MNEGIFGLSTLAYARKRSGRDMGACRRSTTTSSTEKQSDIRVEEALARKANVAPSSPAGTVMETPTRVQAEVRPRTVDCADVTAAPEPGFRSKAATKLLGSVPSPEDRFPSARSFARALTEAIAPASREEIASLVTSHFSERFEELRKLLAVASKAPPLSAEAHTLGAHTLEADAHTLEVPISRRNLWLRMSILGLVATASLIATAIWTRPGTAASAKPEHSVPNAVIPPAMPLSEHSPPVTAPLPIIEPAPAPSSPSLAKRKPPDAAARPSATATLLESPYQNP